MEIKIVKAVSTYDEYFVVENEYHGNVIGSFSGMAYNMSAHDRAKLFFYALIDRNAKTPIILK